MGLWLCASWRIQMERTLEHFSMSANCGFRHISHKIPSVESSPIVGNAFTNSCNDWRDGTYENFKDWSVKQFGAKDAESDEEEVPLHFQKAKDILFEKNRHGYFMLPGTEKIKTIRQKQRVIRSYIGAVYS